MVTPAGSWVGWLLLLAVSAAAGCAGIGDGRVDARPAYLPFLGIYRGSFDSARTEDPADDLNYNPCDPRVQTCLQHHDPLADIVLVLHGSAGEPLQATFYRNAEDRRADRPLDLLGRGCGTRLGSAESLVWQAGIGESPWTARFPLTVENRMCLGKLRPTSTHSMSLAFQEDPESGVHALEVGIDKAVVNENYMYVKEDGVERRVRMSPSGKLGEGRQAQYQVCIENDLGEFDRCVLTDKKLKQFFLPVPLPNGVAANYTWWHDLYPNLKRTRGLYSLEQYTGRFERQDD